ncbi:hypothetical protein ACS126_03230 [Sphingobacterium lactis]|uniref:hypothetical protein n=1 Tax=Sphingobacterium TaxID=28453 RepID=UPI0021A2A0E7|nr:hypothetical protein [Sphingobacterium hotanense]MCT1525834.1 hypothetical protein [Sphingobacterium hotanense]
MIQKLILWPTVAMLSLLSAMAQNVKRQTDKHVINQQERMVFKQWDRKKFTPTKGFLGLNYQYWLTWAWHPNYPKTDLRPLSGSGPQTQRMALVMAMQQTDKAYKLHADTLRNTALTEATNYSGLLTATDPLWVLYYRKEFRELLETQGGNLLEGIPAKEQTYLRDRGVLDWYVQERAELKERLETARRTTLDRGSRILTYHRMLDEYRTLESSWDAKKRNAARFIALRENADAIRDSNRNAIAQGSNRTDIQIANEVLSKAY